MLNKGELEAADLSDLLSFAQVNGTLDLTLQATEDGDLLHFKNAILCHVETNRNNDEIFDDGIEELATTIVGRAIDIEHHQQENAGFVSAARAVTFKGKKSLAIDGLLWVDRYPDEIAGVQAGTHKLSVEADATTVTCSACGNAFTARRDYCEHLRSKKKSGARRQLRGLRGKGAGIVRNPAGSDTVFDRNQMYFVANHAEAEEEEPMHKCPHCGAEGEGDKCGKCGRSMSAAALLADLNEALKAKTAAEEKTATLEAQVETLTQEKTTLEAARAQAEADLTAKAEALTAAEAKIAQAEKTEAERKQTERKTRLKDLVAAEKQDTLLGLDDDAFNTVVASLEEGRRSRVQLGGGLRGGLPEPDAGAPQNGARKISLR